VVPANAGPESQNAVVPPPLETTGGEARVLLDKGETLMQSGDVVSARQFFIKAHDLGDTSAAYWVGQTFDPMVYERMNVRGLKADAAEAKSWYEKAANAGNAEAQTALQSMLSAVQP
jgi:TPR repeat protein